MNVLKLNWARVEEKLKRTLEKEGYPASINYVYGVPRGGIYPALIVSKIIHKPIVEELENYPKEEVLVVDDIVDSGKTKNRYVEYYFISVLNKQTEYLGYPHNDVWVEFPWERMNQEVPAEDAVTRMLEYIGEDPAREGLVETPKRVVKAWDYLFSGYAQDPKDIMKDFAADGCKEIVLLKDIELYSMCEHHLLPFYGKAHVAYIPAERVIGVSKLARLVEIYARRAQIQERIGEQVTHALMKYLRPTGAACIIEAKHLCMQARGIQKQNSVMVTSSLKGSFLDDDKAREELTRLIR